MGMIMKNGVPYAQGSEIPQGGTTGQVLAKASNISGDFKWVNGGGGGGNLPMVKEILWETTDYSTNPDTVTLSDSIMNYDMLYLYGWHFNYKEHVCTTVYLNDTWHNNRRLGISASSDAYVWYDWVSNTELAKAGGQNFAFVKIMGVKFGSSLDGTIGRWEKILEVPYTSAGTASIDLSSYNALIACAGNRFDAAPPTFNNAGFTTIENFDIGDRISAIYYDTTDQVGNRYFLVTRTGENEISYTNGFSVGGVIYGYKETAISDADVQRIAEQVPSSGLPKGGTTGQTLVKKSDADGDAEWKDALSGGVGRTIDVLFENTTTNNPDSITLTKSMSDYEEIMFLVYTPGSQENTFTASVPTSDIDFSNGKTVIGYEDTSTVDRRTLYRVVSSTELTYTQSATTVLKKIYGVNYGSSLDGTIGRWEKIGEDLTGGQPKDFTVKDLSEYNMLSFAVRRSGNYGWYNSAVISTADYGVNDQVAINGPAGSNVEVWIKKVNDITLNRSYVDGNAATGVRVYGYKEVGVSDADIQKIAQAANIQSTVGRWKRIGQWTGTTDNIALDLSPYQAIALSSTAGTEFRNTAIKLVSEFGVNDSLMAHVAPNVHCNLVNKGNGLYRFVNTAVTGGVLYGYIEEGLSDTDLNKIANQIDSFPTIGRWEKIGEWTGNQTGLQLDLSPYSAISFSPIYSNQSPRNSVVVPLSDFDEGEALISENGDTWQGEFQNKGNNTYDIRLTGASKSVLYGYKETALADSDVQRIAAEVPGGNSNEFVVKISGSGTSTEPYAFNKTFQEIADAINDDKYVYAVKDNRIYNVVRSLNTLIEFECAYVDYSVGGYVYKIIKYSINSSESISRYPNTVPIMMTSPTLPLSQIATDQVVLYTGETNDTYTKGVIYQDQYINGSHVLVPITGSSTAAETPTLQEVLTKGNITTKASYHGDTTTDTHDALDTGRVEYIVAENSKSLTTLNEYGLKAQKQTEDTDKRFESYYHATGVNIRRHASSESDTTSYFALGYDYVKDEGETEYTYKTRVRMSDDMRDEILAALGLSKINITTVDENNVSHTYEVFGREITP